MSDVLLLGPDEFDLLERLGAVQLSAIQLDGTPIGSDLRDAGVAGAAVLLVTDVGHASLIPVAREVNHDIDVVLYTRERLPAFVSAQVDLAVDQALVEPGAFVEAIRDRVDERA